MIFDESKNIADHQVKFDHDVPAVSNAPELYKLLPDEDDPSQSLDIVTIITEPRYTQINIFEILSNQTRTILYLLFSN